MVSPTVLRKAAVGFPARSESTVARGKLTLHLSQLLSLVKGIPLIESPVNLTACS